MSGLKLCPVCQGTGKVARPRPPSFSFDDVYENDMIEGAGGFDGPCPNGCIATRVKRPAKFGEHLYTGVGSKTETAYLDSARHALRCVVHTSYVGRIGTAGKWACDRAIIKMLGADEPDSEVAPCDFDVVRFTVVGKPA